MSEDVCINVHENKVNNPLSVGPYNTPAWRRQGLYGYQKLHKKDHTWRNEHNPGNQFWTTQSAQNKKLTFFASQ